ncbi:hypothetical protein XENOCAPTIV_023883 [Xenoophorus captivus]|uniref:Uncharacterized protein n=1 Tax=Xenoophorus captivus TaxID=1517983 RepID=A0ABV0QBB5_9TELE
MHKLLNIKDKKCALSAQCADEPRESLQREKLRLQSTKNQHSSFLVIVMTFLFDYVLEKGNRQGKKMCHLILYIFISLYYLLFISGISFYTFMTFRDPFIKLIQ